MPSDCITFQNSGYFSKLIVDYLNQEEKVQSLYNRFPSIENFNLQIEEKNNSFSIENRNILANQLEKQNVAFEISEATKQNIRLLKSENTFTVTTGHQLNLFTGPIYFIYKIVTTIKLAQELKVNYPDYNFVPIYWMATEDHDFEEINHFNFEGKKISWQKDSKGPVGRLSTIGLDKVFEEFSNKMNNGVRAKFLEQLFEESYLNHKNLADATRYLVNRLFKEFGLVIVDGDNPELKKIFIPYIQEELLQQKNHLKVEETSKLLQDYKVQVNPREINLFYITDTLRERIVFEDNLYKIKNTALHFTEKEILIELESHPERFSPNVILRPLYQEVILPNLAYIGGGGELAYWLQLKSMFIKNNIPFPILQLRNSVLVVSEKHNRKREQLNLNWHDLFLNQEILIQNKTNQLSNVSFDFSKQKEFLIHQFNDLRRIASKTDKSFIGAVNAQEAKQIKGLEKLEKRLLKAERIKHREALHRISDLQNQLFPNQSLQERKINFSEVAIEIDTHTFIKKLLHEFELFSNNFNILTL
jgi:bacillithiol biosynthesis cysteine-adding enzyme BshC